MPLDPSIILSGKQPEIQNPLDAMSRVLQFKSLANKNQLEQQQFDDNSAIRNAWANNTKVDQNGQSNIDRAGMFKDLAQSAPHLVTQMQQNLASNDIAMHKANLEHMAIGIQALNGVNDQASYDQAKKQAVAMGGDISQWQPQYDPAFVDGMKRQLLTVHENYELQFKQQGLAIQEKEANIKTQELARSLNKDNASQVQETLQSLQSARGNPAVQQAERDIYSNSKVNKLVAQGVDKKGNLDPNALNNTQVRLLAGEVAKIATGGAPTLDELHGLTPQNMPQWLASAAEKYRNSPTGANAGEFVKQLQAYSNGVAADAKGLLKDNYQGIIESKKKYLPKDAYQTLNDQFMGRLNATTPASEWSLSKSNGSKDNSNPVTEKNSSGGLKGVMSFSEWKASQKQAAKNPKGRDGS